MGMLVLTRKQSECITIFTTDGPIRVMVVRLERGQARIGVDAPRHVRVMRDELLPPGGAAG